MPILSETDLEFWRENGYVIAREAITREQADLTAQALCDYTGIDLDCPKTWYENSNLQSMMVEIYHHQALWNNRQDPRVYEAFRQVWQEKELWVSVDRASINVPSQKKRVREPRLHWDINFNEPPLKFAVQGMIYLTDTAENQGAFMCVPGFHKELETYISNLTLLEKLKTRVTWAGLKRIDWPKKNDLNAMGAKRISARAGDLIIWHRFLPHVASRNTASHPRLAQYVSFSLADEKNEAERERRINIWQQSLQGLGTNIVGQEYQNGDRAILTALGRKILGVDSWNEDMGNE